MVSPCLGIVGPSKSGKTTLIEQLIPLLSPLNIAVLKHSHHLSLGPELPSKDSVRYRAAGAVSALSVPADTGFETAMNQLLAARQVDLVLVESFRSAPIPKLLYAPMGLDTDWHIPEGLVAQVGSSIDGLLSIADTPQDIARWIESNYTGRPG